MLVVGIAALALFVAGAFYVTRIAERIRSQLQKRHPQLFLEMAPTADANWTRHWSWQNPFNVALAALPHVDALGDETLSADARRLRVGIGVLIVCWVAVVAFFGYLLIS